MTYEQGIALVAELGKAGYTADLTAQNYQTIADELNDREVVANPTPQTQTPVQFTWTTFLALLSPAEILGLYGYGNFAIDLKNSLEQNDRTVMNSLWRAIKSVMPVGTVTDVETAFAATELDPTWRATILLSSIAQTLGLPTVTARDVQSAHHKIAGV